MRMITRQNEIYSILGMNWGEQSSPAPRTRQEEIFDIVSFPAVSRRTSPNDVGATLAVARPQGSPTGEPWTPQPAAPTAPLSGEPNTSSGAYAPPSPQGEGRSAEQVQQELADSRKQLAQLGADAAYIVTAEQGAELGRQMDEVRARIKALNTELDALKTPNTNAERDSLIQRMNDISAYEGYATTVEQADAVTREKQETRQRLHQLDEELGNAARFYDSGERAPAVIKGALKQTGSAYTNFMGTLQGAGNRLHEASSDFDKAVAGSEYSGWATDELSAANIAASSDGKGLEALEREEQRLYEKADAMVYSAAKDIAQAKEGLSALGQAGVDISVNLIQNGIDAAGKAVGLGMLPFFVRAAGSASMDARHEGASTGQQVFYGLTKGGIEVATELLSGGIAGTGTSGLDDVIEPLIDKLVKSTAGRIALNAIYDAAMEGGEEVLSDLLDPFAKLIYNNQALKEAWENRADVGAQMLYDYLIGAVVGSIGSGTKIVTGVATRQNAENNTKLAEVDALANGYANATIDVGSILSGGHTTAQSIGTAIKAPAGNNVPLQQNIDNAAQQRYTEINEEMNGGTENGIRDAGLQQNDPGRSVPENRAGIPGIYQYGNSDNSGQRESGGVRVDTGFVLISEKALSILQERGIAPVEAKDVSTDKTAFSSAHDAARNSNTTNGWAVTPKSAEELEQSGARLFMDERGSAGLAVAPDGDIEAVFANKAAGAPKSATKSLIPMAIANGGTKLDCYGEGLVSLYAQYGFTPVARTKFDPQYANPGWDPSKGTPDIFFMLHNGDNADTVVQKNGNYPVPTAEQLNALPEMDYDSAYAYRDRLLAERSGKGAPEGSPSGGAVERSGTEGGTTAAEATAKTDPAAAALQQQYQTEITAALRAGDYQRALALFKEFGNPNLRALNNFQTLKAFGDYAAAMGYDVSPEDISTDQTLAAFEESYQNAIENSAKDGIIAAGTPTDHFDRKARLYGLEEDLAAVNPNFSTGKYEWTHNCQRCVSTLEMRFRGFKVTAKPIPGKVEYDDLALNVELAWKNAVRKWCALPNGKNQIEDYMRRWGDGSRAIVGMMFPSGLGHVFFAMQIDGKTVFVDPQYPAADCEQYFKRYVKGGLYVIRVDNLQPLERITDCCKSGDE